MDSSKIIEAVQGVTGKWARQRKAEERKASAVGRRHYAFVRSVRTTIKEAAYQAMPQAYLKASSNNSYPAHARQVMYAARGPIQLATGEILDDQYFTQTLLPDYLIDNPRTTADWDVVFDARGHFEEPHTGLVVPLGTMQVRDYLSQRQKDPQRAAVRFPTDGPAYRFGAILFIEKEGFLPLFRRALLAERYDVAIMSTKGVSVTAARKLVDELSGQGVPCLVLRDFDKAGFTIVKTLRTSGRRYTFQHRPLVTDLGLRLADVEANGLEGEDVFYGKSDPRDNPEDNGATEEEMEFLCSSGQEGGYTGQRVELNAFASGDLLQWVEDKLQEAGVHKVIPSQEVLTEAYRRAYAEQLLRRQLRQLRQEVAARAQAVQLPLDMEVWLRRTLERQPALPWDQAVARRAARDSQQAQSM